MNASYIKVYAYICMLLLSVEYEMQAPVSHVEGLVPSWQFYFGNLKTGTEQKEVGRWELRTISLMCMLSVVVLFLFLHPLFLTLPLSLSLFPSLPPLLSTSQQSLSEGLYVIMFPPPSYYPTSGSKEWSQLNIDWNLWSCEPNQSWPCILPLSAIVTKPRLM